MKLEREPARSLGFHRSERSGFATVVVLLLLAGCISLPTEPSPAWTQCAERYIAIYLETTPRMTETGGAAVGRLIAQSCGRSGVSQQATLDALDHIAVRLYNDPEARRRAAEGPLSDTFRQVIEHMIAESERARETEQE